MNPRSSQDKPAILRQLGNKSIVFLGMMGCGKSAIGKLVSQKLGLEFKDADSEIEQAAGRSITDIFSDFGEEEFRRLEARVVARILSQGPVLLALGGGAFMNSETREVIADNAISVWLQADIELLLSRVARRPNKRPLLKEGNPRDILEELMQKRNPVYALANVHVQTMGGTKTQTRDIVLEAIGDYLAGQDGRKDLSD